MKVLNLFECKARWGRTGVGSGSSDGVGWEVFEKNDCVLAGMQSAQLSTVSAIADKFV